MKNLFLMTFAIILSGCAISNIGESVDKEVSLSEKNGLVYKCVSTPSRWTLSLQAPEDFTLASITKLVRGATSSGGGIPDVKKDNNIGATMIALVKPATSDGQGTGKQTLKC